jgi:hypothetical protein
LCNSSQIDAPILFDPPVTSAIFLLFVFKWFVLNFLDIYTKIIII